MFFTNAAIEFLVATLPTRENYATYERLFNAGLRCGRRYRIGHRPSNRNKRDTAERNYMAVR